MNELTFSSFDTEMVQPALVRTEKALALRADYRRQAIKVHDSRAAKRRVKEALLAWRLKKKVHAKRRTYRVKM